MKVSIIIPCYQQAHFLKDAIESALSQTHQDVEVIVVDDGDPTDHVLTVCQKYPEVTYIKKPNGGLSSARNRGIKEAKGELILPLDADDKIHKDFLTITIQYIKAGYDIVSTWLQTFGNENRSWGSENLEPKWHHFSRRNEINCCSLFYKKMWKDLGGYDENMRVGFEDWDLWRRASLAGYKFRIVNEYLFFYRKHSVSMFADAQKKREHLIEYMKIKESATKKLIDVVYVVGNGSVSANNELRFSLRSVQKYLSGFRKIYVIGEKIKFLKNVNHHYVPDPTPYKAQNILHKILYACKLPDLSNDFLFINDDHFFLERVDAVTYPYYYDSDALQEILQTRSVNDPYHRMTADTMAIFGDDFKFYDIHKPIVYNKGKFKDMVKHVPFQNYEHGLLIKSSYCNFVGVEGVRGVDTILRAKYTTKEIEDRTLFSDVFSIHDAAVCRDFVDFMDKTYNFISDWE